VLQNNDCKVFFKLRILYLDLSLDMRTRRNMVQWTASLWFPPQIITLLFLFWIQNYIYWRCSKVNISCFLTTLFLLLQTVSNF